MSNISYSTQTNESRRIMTTEELTEIVLNEMFANDGIIIHINAGGKREHSVHANKKGIRHTQWVTSSSVPREVVQKVEKLAERVLNVVQKYE